MLPAASDKNVLRLNMGPSQWLINLTRSSSGAYEVSPKQLDIPRIIAPLRTILLLAEAPRQRDSIGSAPGAQNDKAPTPAVDQSGSTPGRHHKSRELSRGSPRFAVRGHPPEAQEAGL